MANVRFGSKADISECLANVRFTPESGHQKPSSAICRSSFVSFIRRDPSRFVFAQQLGR